MKKLINKNIEDKDTIDFIDKFKLERLNDVYESAKTIHFQNSNNTIGLSVNKETNKVLSVYFEKGKGDISGILLDITLLFGIRFKDTMEEVVSNIGIEPTLVSQNKEQNIIWDKAYHHTYFSDEIAIRIWFNINKEVISFSYSKIDDFYKEHFQWKNGLLNQNLNRKADIEHLKQQSPISIWKERLKENELLKQQESEDYIEDYWYTKERLEQIKSMLDNYLKQLKKCCSNNEPIEIEKSLRNVILKINEFNQGVNMIETDEREELCSFFDKTINATGIELPKNFDPTLIYRNW